MANPGNEFSSSEVLSPPVPGGTHQPLVPVGVGAGPLPPPPAGGAAGSPPVLQNGFDQVWLYHCLRRRWLMALLFGVAAACAAAALMWWMFPESSRTVAYLRIKAKPPEQLLSKDRQHMSTSEMERFAASQLALMKSNKVLEHALQHKRIAQLEAVKAHEPDPVQWLIEDLKVSYLNESEILEVRYDGDESPAEMEKIVNEVVQSFMLNIIDEDRKLRENQRLKLADMHREIEEELSEQLRTYNRLVEEFGGKGSGTAEIEIQLLTTSIRTAETELATARKELQTLEVETAVQIQMAQSQTAIEAAIAEAMDNDPTIANYTQELYTIDQRIRELSSGGRGKASPELKRLYAVREQAARQIQAYRDQTQEQLRREIASRPNEALQNIYSHYRMTRQALEKQIAELEAKLEEMQTELVQKGATNPELQTLLMEIEQLQEVEQTLELEVRGLQLSKESEDQQVTIAQNAIAQENINWIERVAISTIGGLVGFASACYCVALIDFRRRRLNGPENIDDGLGLRVLGVLPSVTNRKALAGNSLAAAQTAEGIDNVRATLMHESTANRRQIVMVTSSESLDGCSTVATQLAVSLAKAGRRTLLIDGDVRAPSLHNVFGLPLEDGFCEVVRSEIDLADAVRPTGHDGLYLLTAGVVDNDAIHALATDLPQPIFEKLRGQFDFVVIDTAPAPDLSDTLSLGQYSDGAILAVLRDHSQLVKVSKTATLLRGMGISLLGVVVGGVPMKADRRVVRLLKSQGSKQPKLPAAAPAAASEPSSPPPADEVPTDDFSAGLEDIDFDRD